MNFVRRQRSTSRGPMRELLHAVAEGCPSLLRLCRIQRIPLIVASGRARLDRMSTKKSTASRRPRTTVAKYLYHETRRNTLDDIRHDGLRPHSYGQSFVDAMAEMSTPDMYSRSELKQFPLEDRKVRTYVSLSEPRQLNYGEVLLRFPRDMGGPLRKDVDHYITRTVPPGCIEVLQAGNWIWITGIPTKCSKPSLVKKRPKRVSKKEKADLAELNTLLDDWEKGR